MNSLKNHILIPMPHLSDPCFGKSVVLLCDHTTDGAMGIVVNRPISDPELKKLFSSGVKFVKSVDDYQEMKNLT